MVLCSSTADQVAAAPGPQLLPRCPGLEQSGPAPTQSRLLGKNETNE